jgi:MFS family permease
MFRNVLFSLNLIMALLVFVVLAGNFITPFYLELVKGYSTEQVGLFMMVYPVCMGSVAPIAGGLSDRYGSRLISLVGLLLIIAGCYSISTLQLNTDMWGIILRLIPFGLGMGIFQSPNNSAVMGTAPLERLGVASGLLALTRTLGQTTGLPLMGTLFTTTLLTTGHLAAGADITNAPPVALVEGVTGTYQTAAVIILAATALAALALWIDNRAKRKVSMEISSPEPQGHI